MRMEELINNNFIKSTDSIERYLLDIIRQYFSSNNVDDDSREYIIKKAVERMKQELHIDNAGVLSVNGETGNIEITLTSLGGEPLISPKLSAFNVNFGDTENTACMGNDPRLSDNRHPLAHNHDISEINGLAGELSTIRHNIGLLGVKTHSHTNKNILDMLTYTGSRTSIDLTILDDGKQRVDNAIANAQTAITDMNTQMYDLTNQVETELNNYTAQLNTITDYIDNKITDMETTAKQYVDDRLDLKTQQLMNELSNKISKPQLNSIIHILNQQFSIMYETSITNFITSNNSNIEYSMALPTDIVNTLATLTENQYKIEFHVKHVDQVTGENITVALPFIYADSAQLLYTIKGKLQNKNTIIITSTKQDSTIWPSFMSAAVIRVRILKTNNLAEVV